MQLVRAGRNHSDDMATGPFPILRAIAVLEQVEFPHRIHPEGLPAGAGGPDRLAGGIRSDVLHAVNRKRIFFRPPAHHGKEVAVEIHIGGVIDCAGRDRHQLVEAAAVQRQVFNLRLVH